MARDRSPSRTARALVIRPSEKGWMSRSADWRAFNRRAWQRGVRNWRMSCGQARSAAGRMHRLRQHSCTPARPSRWPCVPVSSLCKVRLHLPGGTLCRSRRRLRMRRCARWTTHGSECRPEPASRAATPATGVPSGFAVGSQRDPRRAVTCGRRPSQEVPVVRLPPSRCEDRVESPAHFEPHALSAE